jgi:hypothetical protein
MFDDMTPEQLRAELAKFQKPESAPQNPGANTLSPDELRANAILKGRTDAITPDDKAFLRAEILAWEKNRNA